MTCPRILFLYGSVRGWLQEKLQIPDSEGGSEAMATTPGGWVRAPEAAVPPTPQALEVTVRDEGMEFKIIFPRPQGAGRAPWTYEF